MTEIKNDHFTQESWHTVLNVFVMAAIVVILFTAFIVDSYADVNSQAASVLNASPSIDTVVVTTSDGGFNSSSIEPAEGDNKTLYIQGVATDPNGCTQLDDVSQWTFRMYRSTISGGYGCSADSSNCYLGIPNSQLTLSECSGGSDSTINFSWVIPIVHYLEPTDSGALSGADWKARVTVTDDADAVATATGSFEVATLRAINVDTGITYGNLTLGEESVQKSLEITNTGNQDIDVYVHAGGPLICERGSIPAGNVHYSLSNSFSYNAGSGLAGSDAAVNMNVTRRTSAVSKKTMYFKLKVPDTGVGGTCINTLTFSAKEDE